MFSDEKVVALEDYVEAVFDVVSVGKEGGGIFFKNGEYNLHQESKLREWYLDEFLYNHRARLSYLLPEFLF